MSRLHTGFATRSRKNLNGDFSPSLTVDSSRIAEDGPSPLTSPSLPAAKLTKPRTNDSSSKCLRPLSASKLKAEKPAEVDMRSSFSDMRSAESRLKMRQQLTSPSSDSPHNASTESFVTADQASLEDRSARSLSSLDVYHNDEPLSSTSTANAAGLRKAGAVGEPQKIDLEAAIHLLQELKKSATPEELVALHRALLPTKDADAVVNSSNKTADKGGPHSSERKRSTLPPGLATRGGITEDLLRKPGERKVTTSVAKDKSTKLTAWGEPGQPSQQDVRLSSPTSKFAKRVNSDSITRPETPSDAAYGHTGGYLPGTLHITNGRASPTPSGRSGNGVMHALRFPDTPAPPIDGQAPATSSFNRQDGPPAEDQPIPVSPIESPPSTDTGVNKDLCVDRFNPDNDAINEEVRDKHWSTDVAVLPVGSKSASQLQVPQQGHDSDTSYLRSPTSPTLPTSLQRRMKARDVAISVMSQEYMDECVVSGSPYEDSALSPALPDVVRTTSQRGHVRQGTPEDALDILSGSKDEKKSPDDVLNNNDPNSDRPKPRHADSGYASDASLQAPQRNTSLPLRRSTDVNESKPVLDRTRWSPQLQQEEEEEAEESDNGGLTFEEALASASLYKVRVPKPASGGVTRKPSRLLALRPFGSAKRVSSAIEQPQKVVPNESTDSVPSSAAPQPSPVENKEPKEPKGRSKSKKLQKAPPKVVREKNVGIQNAKPAKESTLPEVPDALTDEHAKRLEATPSVSHLEHTHRTADPQASTDAFDNEPQIAYTEIKFPSPTPSPVKERFSLAKTFSRSRNGQDTNLEFDSDSDVHTAETTTASDKRENTRGRSTRSKKRSSSLFSKKPIAQSKDGPACTDFGDVTEMLGSSPYDVSTAIIKSSPAHSTPGSITSPFAISGPIARSRTRPGMSEEVASQVARMRSRDRAGDSLLLNSDCPRVVKPVEIQPKRSRSTPRSGDGAVEERFPNWQPVGRRRGPPKPRFKSRAYSEGAEAIPPLPVMPADAQRRAQKADILVAKTFGSAKSSPNQSTRSSLESSGTESDNADKVRAALEARNAQWQKIKKQEEAKVLLHCDNLPDLKRQASNAEMSAALQSTHLGTPNDQRVTALAVEKTGNWDQNIWAKSAAAWSERRKILGETLPSSTRNSVDAKESSAKEQLRSQPKSLPTSPSIVVSRYITPAGQRPHDRDAISNRPTDLASKHAIAYQDLLYGNDDQENQPPEQRNVELVDKHRNSGGVRLPNKLYATAAAVRVRSRSPGGHVRTASGSWIPYSPAVAKQVEESLARSKAILTENKSIALTEEPKSLLREPVRHRPSTSPTTSFHFDTVNSNNSNSGDTSPIPDRYSGGLGYGWDRQVGFIGSAGVNRHNGRGVGSRRSVGMNDQFGLDLTDVPVFLARVQNAIRDV